MSTLAAPADNLNAFRAARHIELKPGERITGTVTRLPQPGVAFGNRLFLQTRGPLVSVAATAKAGATILVERLAALNITVGDRVTVTLLGLRETADRERTYKNYLVQVAR